MGKMKIITSMFLALCLMLPVFVHAEMNEELLFDDDFLLEEDADDYRPDPLRQAKILMRHMTLEEKIGQMIMISPEDMTGEKRSERIAGQDIFSDFPVGGVILYGQNISSEEQLRALIQDIYEGSQNAGLYPPFIAVDEEGGYVARIANKLGIATASSAEATGLTGDAQNAFQNGRMIGAYLKEFGINLDLAPVADVLIASAPELEGRSYGTDPQLVSQMARMMAEGLRDEGIIPCFKHFPGHGAAGRNAHNVPVSHGRSLAEMQSCELIPFEDAIRDGAEMIMMSHLKINLLDSAHPASLSRVLVTDVLRNTFGFQGVVITDALRMDAIKEEYSISEAAVLAVDAGVDILLVPGDGKRAFDALVKAVENGTISMERIDESVARILALKIKSGLIQ